MSTDKKKTEAPTTLIPFEATPEGWIELGQKYLYRPADCDNAPIWGCPVDKLAYGSDEDGFEMYLIVTTRPTIGLQETDKRKEYKKVVVPAGASILVAETYGIKQLDALVENTARSYEVRIQPQGKVPLEGGKTMWKWSFAVNPKALPRMMAPTFELSQAPQLTAEN